MPRLGLLLALLIASVPAFGQDRRSDEHSYAQPDKVRIRDLALDLAIDFDKRQLAGTATLSLDWIDEDQRDLVLDTRDLAIAAVEARNGKRKFREVPFVLAGRDERFGSKLTITLPRQYEQVRITYATSPEASGLQWLAPEMTASGISSPSTSRATSCSRRPLSGSSPLVAQAIRVSGRRKGLTRAST